MHLAPPTSHSCIHKPQHDFHVPGERKVALVERAKAMFAGLAVLTVHLLPTDARRGHVRRWAPAPAWRCAVRAGRAAGQHLAVPPVAVRRCRLAQSARKLTTVACAGVDVGDIQASVDWASTPAPLIVGVAVFTFSGIAAALPASLSPRQVVRGCLWAKTAFALAVPTGFW